MRTHVPWNSLDVQINKQGGGGGDSGNYGGDGGTNGRFELGSKTMGADFLITCLRRMLHQGAICI